MINEYQPKDDRSENERPYQDRNVQIRCPSELYISLLLLHIRLDIRKSIACKGSIVTQPNDFVQVITIINSTTLYGLARVRLYALSMRKRYAGYLTFPPLNFTRASCFAYCIESALSYYYPDILKTSYIYSSIT